MQPSISSLEPSREYRGGFFLAMMRRMKIFSWNILYQNKKLDEAFEFIRSADFDVFCLQEVPARFLERLRTLPVHLAAIQEAEVMTRRIEDTIYTVTLSRYPIERTQEIPLPKPPRSLFSRFMFLIGIWGFAKGARQACVTDIASPLGPIRIFNLHLSLTYPELRAEEFERSMLSHSPRLRAIVCGDFNILESPQISLLNWLLGGRITDMLFWTRERTEIEDRFIAHELTNPLRGMNTHPISRSQLDHILVSRALSVEGARVIPERHGSDHHPITATVSVWSTT